MRTVILTAVISGIMILGASPVFAEGARPSEPELLKTEMQVQKNSSIPSFEKRLNLKPLSDEELEQISAAGLGPIMPFPFQPVLFLPFLFPTHDFLRFNQPINPQIRNTFQAQSLNFGTSSINFR